MLVRNLDFLSIPKEFSKVELDIYQGQSIALVYIENKGYSLVLKENDAINSVFLLKTELTPDNINSDKEDFINVIKMLLDRIYSAADIINLDGTSIKKDTKMLLLKSWKLQQV